MASLSRERDGTGDARHRDVLVVGAGVIGLSLARELARRGSRVTVLERGAAGEEASWAAAGMLVPQSLNPEPGPLFDLLIESLGLYPDWVRGLEEETGEDVGFRRTGLLACALDDADERSLARFDWQKKRGLRVDRWEPSRVAGLLGRDSAASARPALHFPDEGVVDPRRLSRALAHAALRRGVELRTATAARGLWIEEGRCRGVATDAGRLEAGSVVNASGAWAGFDRDLPFPVPVEPVRGQLVELHLPDGAPTPILHSEPVYLAPQGAGRLLVGSTLERVGFEKRVTADAVGRLIADATRLWPAVAGGRFVAAWAGLRPGTRDGLPILGDCAVPRLFFATGHYRNGILLAPVTALRLADALAGSPSADLSAFSVSRFAPAGAAGRGSAEASRPEDFK